MLASAPGPELLEEKNRAKKIDAGPSFHVSVYFVILG